MMAIFKSVLFFMFLVVSSAIFGIAPNYTLMAPMRDGTELHTDIYLPADHSGPSPVILIRSPAGRQTASALIHTELTQKGYVVAIQSTRSALDEEGKTLPYLSDGWAYEKDGYDTVEWLAKNPICNGKVGTVGSSALGITQLLLAPTAPPSLVCQYIGVAASSLYHQAIYPGGQLLKNQVEGWLGYYAKDTGVFAFVVNQPHFNEFWSTMDTHPMASHVRVPGLHQGGWYDTFLKGTIEGFVSRQNEGGEGAKGTQKLLIGPWDHYWPKENPFGEFKIPDAARQVPFPVTTADWFDYHLKGEENGVEKLPAVIYYVMGPFDGSSSSGNVWKTSEVWPVPSKPLMLYLTKEGGFSKTSAEEKSILEYAVDSANPVPTLGGRNLFLLSGPVDQRPIEARDDVLVFTSEPLEEDLEVTGDVLAKITFQSDFADGDIAVRLTDVYPDGKSILIVDGLARVFDETEKQQPITSRQVTVDLWPTSFVFAKGHRIRISISGSNYPKYEVNKLTGFTGTNTSEYKKGRNGISLGGELPSVLILPVSQNR